MHGIYLFLSQRCTEQTPGRILRLTARRRGVVEGCVIAVNIYPVSQETGRPTLALNSSKH